MSTLRKYNRENHDWEPFASSDAGGIYTNNSILTLREDGEKVSVEDILLQNRAELDLLLHNVSWLALHGGGSGIGGGGAFDFKIEIINPIDKASVISNLDIIGTIVWTNQIELESYLTYKVSSKSRATFLALVMLNGNIILKDNFTAKNQTINVPISTIKKYLGSGGTLSIQVEDVASETRHNVQCLIIISTTMLYDGLLRLTLTLLDSSATRTLRLIGKATITGNYKLYYSNNLINAVEDPTNKNIHFISGGVDLDEEEGHFMNVVIPNTSTQTFQIDVIESGLIPQGISSSGTYNRYFMLVNESDPNIRSGLAGVIIIITVTDGILVVPLIGSETVPYPIAKDNILPLLFAVFSSLNGTFNYSVRYKNAEALDSEYLYLTETVTGNIFNESITKNINLININGIEEPENDDDVKIYKLEIGVRYGTITSVGYTYIKILKAKSKLLSTYKKGLENYTVFDYSFITGEISNTYTNNDYLYLNLSNLIRPITSIMSFGNIGQDSGNTGNYYKFRHFAYALVLTNSYLSINHWFPISFDDSESLILYNNWEFTIEVSYHVDEEVRDDLVIFNLGNYNFNEDKSGYGIVITPHKLYFKIEKTSFEEDLLDNSFTQLNIVCEIVNNIKYIKVYYNGKLLKVTPFVLDGNPVSLSLNKIFLGGYLLSDGLPTNNIDFDLYSLKFYTTSLNVGLILCSYINNYVSYNYDGEFASELMTKLCLNNAIDLDNDGKDSQTTSKVSSVYDISSGNYTWNITELDGVITLPDSFKNLPIPIVTLRVGWSFAEFTAGGLSPTIAKFDYYDGNVHLNNDNVTVEQLGTTSGNYEIKNVKIIFNNDLLFSPKDDWFPEKEFTLKADIVDSGHINNAVIGKFVNHCFNNTGLMNVQEAFPCVSKLKEYQNLGALPSTFTVKAAIEGFPCLLIINFNNGNGVRDILVLGIYSFNLGREAEYNQGYKLPKKLYKTSGVAYGPGEVITFPNFFLEPPAIDIDTSYKSCCFEGKATHNCKVEKLQFDAEHYNFAKIIVDGNEQWYPQVEQSERGNILYNYKEILNSNGDPIPYNSTNVEKYNMIPDGYFWSNDETYYGEHLWNNVGGTLSGDDARVELGKLNRCVALKIPYKKGTILQAYGDTVKQYTITGETGESINTAPSGNPDYVLINALSDAESIELSVLNTAFYYVIAMLFGLMDSLGKNLQLKFWKSDSEDFYWSPTFYDMDTALGISNIGNVDVTPDVLDYSLFNTLDAKILTLWGNAPLSLNHITTVYSNKLWGIENPVLVRLYKLDFAVISEIQDNPNFFALMWNNLRKQVVTNANLLFEDYFENLLKDCGEFLLNYDYLVKYLNTAQVDFLHGDRLAYIKNWLNKRIVFLDSVFGYSLRILNGIDYKINNYLKPDLELLTGDNISMYNTPWNNQINFAHNTGVSTIPITTNNPVIMKVVIGGNLTQYTFVPNNISTNVAIAGNTIGDLDILSVINNTNCIVDISQLKYLNIKGITSLNSVSDIKNLNGNNRYDSDKINLKNLYGSLSSLRVFDMSNTTSISSSLNMFQLFKTWDNSPFDKKTYPFGLQEINFNNTRSTRDGIIDFNLDFSLLYEGVNNMPTIYNSPFVNLIKIDISGSNVSNITIPEGVSLYRLNVANSAIGSLKLTNLSLLTSLNLNGCSSLTALTVVNCLNFTSLSFNNTNKSLQNIIVSGCHNLTSFVIEADSLYLDVPNVSILDCPSLTSIVIRNCSVKSSNINKVLTIKNCNNLSNITVYNSAYDIISWDKLLDSHSLSVFNITYSSIYALTTLTVGDYTSVKNIIDLSGISSINTLNFGHNEQVEYVKFNNINGTPFIISTLYAFTDCKKLKRVYGNIELKNNSIFYRCNSFSILGVDTTEYNGISVMDGTRVKHFKEIDEFKDLLSLPFLVELEYIENVLDEVNVTNMTFGSSNCSNDFYNTACTILDAYYILYRIGSGTNISELFFSASNINWNWTNSPSRYMFINCRNVTTVSYAFRNTGSGLFKIYSPIFEDDTITSPGLFTPLTSCTNIEGVFLGCSYSCDRNVFRLEGQQKFSLNNICRFSPTYIADNLIESTIQSSITSLFTTDNMADGENNNIGNLDNLFYNFNSNVTMYLVFNNTKYINYSKLLNGLLIPLETRTNSNISTYSIRRSFNSEYSYGEITFDKLFKKDSNNKYQVRGIYGSFRTTGGSIFPLMTIYEDMFADFSNILCGIGFYGSNNGDLSSDYKDSQGDYSFKGVRKNILLSNNDFPYDILSPILNNLVIFSGFFSGATYDGTNTVYPLDEEHGIFRNCTKIKDVSYTFYNVKFNYELSSCGFKNCKNLLDVSYLFATDTPESHDRINYINRLIGLIPYKLFYHGRNGNVISAQNISGINDEILIVLRGTLLNGIIKVSLFIDTTGLSNFVWIITEDHYLEVKSNYTIIELTLIDDEYLFTILCSPLTEINENTITETQNELEEIISLTLTSTFLLGEYMTLLTDTIGSYEKFNKNIRYMTGCFLGANISYYSVTNDNTYIDNIEFLSNYSPFKYIKSSGKWLTNRKRLTNKATLKWIYDGTNSSHYTTVVNNSSYTFEDPDISGILQFNDEIIYYINSRLGDSTGLTNTGNYCCPLDLLRYCKSDAAVTGLFKNCGLVLGHSGQYNYLYGGVSNHLQYGLKGRIPPYLLLNITDTDNFSEMFYGCKLLGWYSNNGRYTIPLTLFNYTTKSNINLTRMFYGVHFPLNVILNVFKKRNTNTIYNVTLMFKYASFDTNNESARQNWSILSGTFTNVNVKGGANEVFATVETTVLSTAQFVNLYMLIGLNFTNGYYPTTIEKAYYGYSNGGIYFNDGGSYSGNVYTGGQLSNSNSNNYTTR